MLVSVLTSMNAVFKSITWSGEFVPSNSSHDRYFIFGHDPCTKIFLTDRKVLSAKSK